MEKSNYKQPISDLIKFLTTTYAASCIPVALVDKNLLVIWANDTAKKIYTAINLPDGLLLCLSDELREFLLQQLQECKNPVIDTMGVPYSQTSLSFTSICEDDAFYAAIVHFNVIHDEGTALNPIGTNRIVSVFANQFRSPLTTVFSTLSVLRMNAANQNFQGNQKYIQTITQSCYQMLRSCTHLSEYTRYVAGINPFRLVKVELCSLLRTLCEAIAELTSSIDIPFYFDIPSESIVTVCDFDKLSVAILNIVANSCRFTQPDNEIHLILKKVDNTIILTISDKGLGIPVSIQERVFEPYFSYDHEGMPFAGAGLGLTLVKFIVAGHGGSVALNSVEHMSTTLAFVLPIRDDASSPIFSSPGTIDYLKDRFSPLYVNLADTCSCPTT